MAAVFLSSCEEDGIASQKGEPAMAIPEKDFFKTSEGIRTRIMTGEITTEEQLRKEFAKAFDIPESGAFFGTEGAIPTYWKNRMQDLGAMSRQ